MDLGRFQPGQVVTLGVSTVDGSANPAWPDAAPVATIRDSSSNVIWSGKISLDGGAYHFSLPVFVGISYSVGTYQVTYAWAVNGTAVASSDSFDVIAGGDIGGSVVSMYAYVRPEATYVVAQLSSGNLVQGRNPRL